MQTLTGFIRGTLADMKVEDARLLVHAKMRRLKIIGDVVVTTVRRTPAGGVITLKVDDDANEKLGQSGHLIYVSAAELIELFNPQKDKKAMLEKDALVEDVRQLEEKLQVVRQGAEEKESDTEGSPLAECLMEMEVGGNNSETEKKLKGDPSAESEAGKLASGKEAGESSSSLDLRKGGCWCWAAPRRGFSTRLNPQCESMRTQRWGRRRLLPMQSPW